MVVRFIGNDRMPMSLCFMRSGRRVPRRRAGRAARFADEAGTRSAKEMGVPGNRMPRMLEKAGAHRSRARFAASVAAWNGLFPVAVFPCGDCGAGRGSPVPAESRRGFAGMRREPGREAETGREGICRPPSRGRDGQRRFGRCVRPGGWNRRDAASRARPRFYWCTPSTRLASATLSGASSKT